MAFYRFLLVAVVCAFFTSCKKDETVYSNNEIPPYSQVPTILVQNYVNRLYIDLIGREPTDAEMSRDVASLRSGNLSSDARSALVNLLMLGQDYVPGDSSYNIACYHKFYEDQKARYLNGTSEAQIQEEYNLLYAVALQDSLNGAILAYQIQMVEANKIKGVMESSEQLRQGLIDVGEMCRRMMFNSIYDQINMNTFNFINASFDDSFARFPTESELNDAFPAVESSLAGVLFGQLISTKADYLNVLVASDEFDEGLIRWTFDNVLARDPSTSEVYNYLDDMGSNHNIFPVLKSILITDEYAGF